MKNECNEFPFCISIFSLKFSTKNIFNIHTITSRKISRRDFFEDYKRLGVRKPLAQGVKNRQIYLGICQIYLGICQIHSKYTLEYVYYTS